jgi:peptidoglycan/LPS O-acetylase OafA/YrhL
LPAGVAVVGLLAILHQQFGFYVGFEGGFDPLNVVLNMLLFKSDINGVMWSLTVELAATPLIFAATLLYRARGPWPLIAVVAILFGLSFIGQYRDMIGANLAPLYAFVLGVLLHFEGRRLADMVPARSAPFVAVGGMSLFFIAGMLKQGAALMILLDCIGGALLVLSIARWPQLGILKPLDWPVVRFFGRVSYSFYLLHPLSIAPTLRLVASFLDQFPPMGQALILSATTTLATAIPAYLCYKFVEVPGIGIGRAISGKMLTKETAERV